MTTRLTKAERERLRALLAIATPRPWEWWTSCSFTRLSSQATGKDGDVLRGAKYRDGVCGIEGSKEDMALIVVAVNALPALLDALDEAERLLAQACGVDTEWDIDAARAFLRGRQHRR